MAILILDCCRSLARAEFARELRAAEEQDSHLDRKEFLEDFLGRHSELTQFMRLQ
jgi:hypothetical protein